HRRQLEGFRSRLGMVFHSFSLWQHMTVLQNLIEGPVQILGLSGAEATDRAEAHLARVGL
ncbi:histidine/lysine/arginine/ornithine ABC transporter ATP-binding protein, partial [Tritonibacter sp. SIMBA_163]